MNEINVTNRNYEEEVVKSTKPVLVDFWATWCGPCRAMMPVVKQIADEGHIKVCKVNVDEEQELASKFDIMSIPTFIAFKDGKVLGTTLGVQSKNEILRLFE